MSHQDLAMTAMERAQAGLATEDAAFSMDDDSFRSFYERTARPLWAFLSRASGSRSLADDLLQESYVRFLQAKLVSPDEAYLKNYLFRIGSNLLRDHWRRERNSHGAGEVHREAASADPADDLGRRSDVADALGKLKPRERQLLWLAYVEGASHREIASAAGLREASVRPLLFRAKRRMARLLEAAGIRR